MKKIILLMPVLSVIFAFASIETKTKHYPVGKSADTNYIITMTTSQGVIKLKLYNETILHRNNFLSLVRRHFFDSLLFHRVIDNFMIQGGDPQSKNAAPGVQLGNGDVGYTIPAEFNPKYIHKKGALAAARTNNPEKASSGCQFYIVKGNKYDSATLMKMSQKSGFIYTSEHIKAYKTLGGTPHLDFGYTVFGETILGFDIIDKIASAKKDPFDRPLENIYILSTKEEIEIIKSKK